MSCNARRLGIGRRKRKMETSIRMGSDDFSITYHTARRDRTVRIIRIRAAAGNRSRGWLTADGDSLPVALGRGGIKANKREGDGGTPRGTFRPRQLWWRADRHPRPRTFLPVRPIRPEDGWCEDPRDRHYNQPVRLDREQGGDLLTFLFPVHGFLLALDPIAVQLA